MHIQNMAGHLIRRLNQLSTQAFAKSMQNAGSDLTPVQFAALDVIIAAPGIDQAGVAAAIAYDRATIGGVIDRLETKGLVERNVSSQDRRAREVKATQNGERVFAEMLPIVAKLQDEILLDLETSERAVFLELATKMINASTAPVKAALK